LWRKQSDGSFLQVEPDLIHSGDTVKLRLEPNDNGFLTVLDGVTPLVSNQPVVKFRPSDTPELHSDKPLDKELTVSLSRYVRPQAGGLGGSARGVSIHQVAAQQSSADKKDNYAVNPEANPSIPFSVKITVSFK
jgi:hypothetical protein